MTQAEMKGHRGSLPLTATALPLSNAADGMIGDTPGYRSECSQWVFPNAKGNHEAFGGPRSVTLNPFSVRTAIPASSQVLFEDRALCDVLVG